ELGAVIVGTKIYIRLDRQTCSTDGSPPAPPGNVMDPAKAPKFPQAITLFPDDQIEPSVLHLFFWPQKQRGEFLFGYNFKNLKPQRLPWFPMYQISGQLSVIGLDS